MSQRPRTKVHEERVVTADLELRDADGDGLPTIDGHAIRYGEWSQDLGGFRERIMPGAARKTIEREDIRALVNHDPNLVLGRNRAETLELSEDAKGVRNIIRPSDTTYARDLVVNMRAGNVNQQSFAFRVPGRRSDSKEPADTWRAPDDPGIVKRDGLWERDVHELILYDVSIVTFPAYVRSTAHVRSAVGLLDGFALDAMALADIFTRADRGIHLTDTDIDLLTRSIDVLRGYLEPAPAPDDATRDQPANAGGSSIPHLRRLLDLRSRELALTAP